MDPWKVCMPVVADFKHFDEEQEPNPDPHQSESSDPDPHQSDADPQHWPTGSTHLLSGRSDLVRPSF